MIKGMEIATARNYLDARKKIDPIIERIHAIAYLQSLLHDPQEEIKIDSLPLGKIGKMFTHNILKINQILERFASMTEVEIQLKNREHE